MPNTQKKFLKKKEREKKVKVKLAKRREAIRKEAKERAHEEQLEREAFELRNGKPEPILNDPAAIAAREERKKAQVQERLERNLKILEALEKEYDDTHAAHENIQKNLEAEGHKSIKDKLAALHAKAKEMQSMNAALEEYSKPAQSDIADSIAKEEAAQANHQTGCNLSVAPVATGYTPARILDAKEAEEQVREELSG
jgi:hypothetical protein